MRQAHWHVFSTQGTQFSRYQCIQVLLFLGFVVVSVVVVFETSFVFATFFLTKNREVT